jgi:hypothetical protein
MNNAINSFTSLFEFKEQIISYTLSWCSFRQPLDKIIPEIIHGINGIEQLRGVKQNINITD